MIERNIKIAAAFVLYNPTDEDIKNVKNISINYDTVFVFDNTGKQDNNHLFFEDKKYIFWGNGSNNGLAVLYNKAIFAANKKNISWLTLFDQDSRIEKKDIIELINYAKKCDQNKVAVVAPFVQYDGKKTSDSKKTKSVGWVINSGSTLNIRLLQSKGIAYDEAYFIDRLDKDFCMQIKERGLLIIQLKNTMLYQCLGLEINGRRNHSAIRHYYIFRNRFYYNQKWEKNILKRNVVTVLQTAKHVLLVLFNEENKISKVRMLPIAFEDYKNGQFGKYNKGNEKKNIE